MRNTEANFLFFFYNLNVWASLYAPKSHLDGTGDLIRHPDKDLIEHSPLKITWIKSRE
jgi:hypothetical protein